MVIKGEKMPKDVPLTSPHRSLQIPLCTPHHLQPITLVLVYYSTFLHSVVHTHGCHQEASGVATPQNVPGCLLYHKCS